MAFQTTLKHYLEMLRQLLALPPPIQAAATAASAAMLPSSSAGHDINETLNQLEWETHQTLTVAAAMTAGAGQSYEHYQDIPVDEFDMYCLESCSNSHDINRLSELCKNDPLLFQ